MKNLSQDSKLNSDLIQIKRINSDFGIILLNKLNDYETNLREIGKTKLQNTIIHAMITHEIGSEFDLTKNENKSPVLTSSEFNEVSISHSNGYFAVFISRKTPVGIDIEISREIAPSGTPYFLNSTEDKPWTNNELLAIWGAKESYFKKVKGNVKDLRKEASILNVTNSEVKLFCDGSEYVFHLDQTNNYTLVFG